MQSITWKCKDGTDFTMEYDEDAPCILCGLPIKHPSMNGTAVCPWCDMGKNRDGTQMTLYESQMKGKMRPDFEKAHIKFYREHHPGYVEKYYGKHASPIALKINRWMFVEID